MRLHQTALFFFSLLIGSTTLASDRLNLPQLSADFAVNGTELQAIFQRDPNRDNQELPPQLAEAVLSSLSADFRNACHGMMPDFGAAAAAQSTWRWSVTLLHAESSPGVQNALLALRCTVHVPDVTFYDERLAVYLSGSTRILKMVALDQDCTNCSDTYHLHFRQKFRNPSGYLAELSVEHTTENPCCDGGDTDSGERWVLIHVPSGANVLAFDKEAYHYNHDDQDGDTETNCKADVAYERDTAANLKAVRTKTGCTENGQFKAPETTARYIWDEAKCRFHDTGASTPAP